MDVETMIARLQSCHLSCYSGGTLSLHEQCMGYNWPGMAPASYPGSFCLGMRLVQHGNRAW